MKAAPSPGAWGLLCEPAAHKGGRRFCRWDSGITGPYWEALWAWGGPSACPLGLGSRVSAKDRGQRSTNLESRKPRQPLSWPAAPAQPASPVPRTAAVEKRVQQTSHDQGKLRSPGSNIPTSPPANTQDSPEVPGNRSLLQIPGDMALPPLKSSRGDSVSCWQNTATQRPKSTERRQHNSESDTENTTSIFFLSKTCRLVLLSVFLLFFFFFEHTYCI